MPNPRAAVAPLSILALAAMLVGCSDTSPTSLGDSPKDSKPAVVIEDVLSQAEEAGYETQVTLLSDRAVTLDDYKKSAETYIDCVTERGFTVDGPVLNPADNQLLLMQVFDRGSTNAASAKADTDCRSTHMDLVELAYRTSTEPRMEPALIEETERCLDSEGLDYSGDESKFEDFFPAGTEDQERLELVSSCVSQSLFTLYPDIPFVALGF